MIKSANLSECGTFRYFLVRRWDNSLPTLNFIMLNPSTADADIDDPTIRRCMQFARDNGYGGIIVTNLFAFRATDPKTLMAACKEAYEYDLSTVHGPENEQWLEKGVASSKTVCCAWGAHASTKYADPTFLHGLFERMDADVRCLGTSKDGYPKHPLYLRKDQPLVPFRVY